MKKKYWNNKVILTVKVEITDKIYNELILFKPKELNEYVSNAVTKQVKRDLKNNE